MRLGVLLAVMLAMAGGAFAAEWLPVLPQDDVLPSRLSVINAHKEDLQTGIVVVDIGQGNDNPRWLLSTTHLQVLADKVLDLPQYPLPIDDIWPKVKPRDTSYHGLRLMLQTVDGKRFAPITIWKGQIKGVDGTVLAPDYGRTLEYWLFGTARVRRDQLLGAHVLPVLTFEQCRLLGQRIVETRPRQCLLPDNNLLLESDTLPDVAAARVTSFDECLQHGKALIYTFPRRCLTLGGRVFTEPPRVYDDDSNSVPPPADAPLVATPMGLENLSVQVSSSLAPLGMGGGSDGLSATDGAGTPLKP